MGTYRIPIRRGSIKGFFAGDPALKGCWSLDGHARDESGNGNHGTAIFSPIEYFGKFHRAYRFKNTYVEFGLPADCDHISIPTTASVKSLTVATILQWYYPLGNTVNMSSSLYREATGLVGEVRLSIYHLTNGNFYGLMSDSDVAYYDCTETSPNWFLKWNLLALTVNTSTDLLALYRNGRIVATNLTAKKAFSAGTPNYVCIGAATKPSSGGQQSCNGIIEETGLFYRELSPTEISQYYQWAISEPRKYWYYSPQIITGVSPYYYQELCKRRTA